MEMSIEGLEVLMAKLARLGGSVDAAIDKGIGKGIQKIKSDAKVNCPYDTGRLKGSISTEHLEPKVWAVGTNVEYAMFVEFGTGQHGAPGVPHTMQPWRYKDAKGNWHITNGAPPKPYLYPALLGNREYVCIFGQMMPDGELQRKCMRFSAKIDELNHRVYNP